MRRFLVLSFAAATLAIALDSLAQSGPYQYFPLTPCRAVDTRGGSPLGTDTTRNVTIRGVCGVPTSAKAVSLNVTIINATSGSWLAVWPSGTARPLVSMINFDQTDPALANGIIVGVSTNSQDLSVYNNFGNVHVIIDVTGYFQ